MQEGGGMTDERLNKIRLAALASAESSGYARYHYDDIFGMLNEVRDLRARVAELEAAEEASERDYHEARARVAELAKKPFNLQEEQRACIEQAISMLQYALAPEEEKGLSCKEEEK